MEYTKELNNSSDTLELVDRYSLLMEKYVNLAPLLAEKLEEFGRLRNELQVLTIELKKRNIDLDKIEKEIEKK